MRAFFCILLCLFLFASANSQTVRPSVSVIGEAKMSVPPDEVIFSFEIVTSDKNLDVAKRDNDARTARTLKAFRDFGIADQDIKTDSLTIAPKYSDPNDPRGANVLIEYVVNRRIVVTLKNIEKIDKFLAGAIESGVNRVVSISIENSKIQEIRERVRTLALKNAQTKAVAYAKQIGQSIGSAYWIREEGADFPPGSNNGIGIGAGRGDGVGGFIKRVQIESVTNPFGSPVTFALGEIEITETIYVIFELKM
ncbi:MAG: hypothetical protein C4324_12385 [Blastocatellia bacterium]